MTSAVGGVTGGGRARAATSLTVGGEERDGTRKSSEALIGEEGHDGTRTAATGGESNQTRRRTSPMTERRRGEATDVTAGGDVGG